MDSSLRKYLFDAIRAFPIVRFALAVGAVIALVAKLIPPDTAIPLKLVSVITVMVMLLVISSIAKPLAPELKPWGLRLTIFFVISFMAGSVLIFTGYFFQWPRSFDPPQRESRLVNHDASIDPSNLPSTSLQTAVVSSTPQKKSEAPIKRPLKRSVTTTGRNKERVVPANADQARQILRERVYKGDNP